MNENELLEKTNKTLGIDKEEKEEIYKEETLFSISKIIKVLSETSLTQTQTQKILEELIKVVGGIKLDLPNEYDVNVKNPVNTVKVSNLDDIKQNTEIKITNLEEIKIPDNKIVSVSNLKDYSEGLDVLSKLISILVKKSESNKPIEVDLDKYTKESKPLAVRLSTGKLFYNAIMTAVAAGMSTSGLSGIFEIQETIPTDHTKVNAQTTLSYNAAGDVVKIEKVIDGATYTKTISNDDETITDTKVISSWS